MRIERVSRGAFSGFEATCQVTGEGIPPQELGAQVEDRRITDLADAERAARRLLERWCRGIAPAAPEPRTLLHRPNLRPNLGGEEP